MTVRRLLMCGEPQRGDDAAAHEAATRLDPRVLADVEVRLVGGLEVDDLRGLDGGTCVVADTVVGPEPGTVCVWRLDDVAAAQVDGRHSTHALPLPEVLALASALEGRPVDGVFVGLAGGSFELGAGLSDGVAAGMARFVAAIEDAVAGDEGSSDRCA